MADDAKKGGGEGTVFGGVVPPKLPSAAPAKPDQPNTAPSAPPAAPPATSGSSAEPVVPPVLPRRSPVTPPPTPPAAPAAPTQAGQPPPRLGSGDRDEDKTVLIAAKPAGTLIELQRVQPPGHAGTERLDRSVYVLGRSRQCDIRLFSESASRQHAQIERRSDGWYLIALEDKPIIVDGDTPRGAVRLRHRMRLRFGDDELVVFDPAAQADVRAPQSAEADRAQPSSRRSLVLAVAGILLVGAALAAWWWLGH